MAISDDLDGIDAAWIAVDALGQVAVFTTGGQGPVPRSALPSVESGEADVLSLPVVGVATRIIRVPRPDSFVAFAERGFFAYDWSDVHRTLREAVGAYELAAAPSLAVYASQLSTELQAFALATRIGIEFGKVSLVSGSSIGT